jgi:hypothetical protein
MEVSGQLSLFPAMVLTEGDRERFWSKVAIGAADECWEWQASRHPQGYGQFQLKRYPVRASRLAWQLTHGPIPDGQHILHKCDNPPCCNPAHLFLGTAGDNNRDRNSKGRSASGDRNGTRAHPETRPRGEAHPSAKLSEVQVREVLELTRQGRTRNQLAQHFNVCKSTIQWIVRGGNWKHLTSEEKK